MSQYRLVLRQTPPLRVDARALAPLALAALSPTEVERVRLPCGRESVAVAELFSVQQAADTADAALTLDGDLSRFDCVGAGLAGGALHVDGSVGDCAGLGMEGGRLTIAGNAGDLTGCTMRGGWLEVAGSVGDFAASALPGDLDGMRGGTLLVRGNAGARLADRMRRGTVGVLGNAGDFLASRMVAGTLVLAGRCGMHAAWGMRRGSLVFAGPAPVLSPTFVPVTSNADVFWQLLARDLARLAEPFAALPRQRVQRHAGDTAVQGKGELILPV